MGAALDDASVFEHQHQVRATDGAEPMRNHKRRPPAQQYLQCCLQSGFRHRIDGAGRFIQNEDAGVREQCSRKAHKLALSQRKCSALLTHLGVNPLGQRLN